MQTCTVVTNDGHRYIIDNVRMVSYINGSIIIGYYEDNNFLTSTYTQESLKDGIISIC